MAKVVEEKPLIVVAGATGRQGGSVVHCLQCCGKFRVRGLTRNLESEASKALIRSGVDMVSCDFCDPASLNRCLTGAYGLFAMTDHWSEEVQHASGRHTTVSKEEEQGKNLANAAKHCGIKFMVFSSLENTEILCGGRIKNPTFVAKHNIEQFIRGLGIPSAFVYPAWYYSNLGSIVPKPVTGGTMELRYPLRADVCLPAFDVLDLGMFVSAIFENPTRYNGQIILLAARLMTMPEMASIIEEVTHIPTRFVQVSLADAEKEMPKEYVTMLQSFNEVGYYGGRDVQLSRRQFPELPWNRMKTLDQWLRDTGWKGGKLSTIDELSRLFRNLSMEGKVGGMTSGGSVLPTSVSAIEQPTGGIKGLEKERERLAETGLPKGEKAQPYTGMAGADLPHQRTTTT